MNEIYKYEPWPWTDLIWFVMYLSFLFCFVLEHHETSNHLIYVATCHGKFRSSFEFLLFTPEIITWTYYRGTLNDYLALDACQTACTGLWLTETLAVASTFLSGETQGVKLPLLLPVDPLHPGRQEERLPLPGAVRREEPSVLQLCVADVEVAVLVWDLIHGEPVRFLLVHGPADDQLEPKPQREVRKLLCGRAEWMYFFFKCTYSVLQRVEPLLSPSFPELLSAPLPPLQCVLCHRVPLEGAVPLRHPQGGTSTSGHTGEALAAWETEHRHLVEAHIALFTSKPGPFNDGPNCLGLKKMHKNLEKGALTTVLSEI